MSKNKQIAIKKPMELNVLSEQAQMQNWFNSWTPNQMRFHKEMVSKSIDEVEKITEQVLDGCYIAAMVEKLELNLDDCIEVAKLSNENMQEVKEKINKDGELYFKMINDEKLRDKIREEAKTMLAAGQVMSGGVNELKKAYKVPVKDLTIIWAEAKADIKQEKEIPYVVTEKEIEEGQKINFEQAIAITNEKGFEITDNKKESKLKIIEQTIKVQGEYGTYIKDSQGVSWGDENFKDIIEVRDVKQHTESAYDIRIKELNDKIVNMQKELEFLVDEEDKELMRYVEIESVFNL